jgi:hypothetical protein
MSFREHLQRRIFSAITLSAITVKGISSLVALFALMAATFIVPEFPRWQPIQLSSVIAGIAAGSTQIQGSRFDSDGLQWSTPVSIFLSYPPTTESVSATYIPQPVSVRQNRGFRYNRPPPIL